MTFDGTSIAFKPLNQSELEYGDDRKCQISAELQPGFPVSCSLSIFKTVLVSSFLATRKLGPLVFLFFFQLAKKRQCLACLRCLKLPAIERHHF